MSTDTRGNIAACSKYEALLEDYLTGDLNVADAKGAAEHWRTCAGCREALEKAEASARLFRAAEPSPDPGPQFARAVMIRIRAVEQARKLDRAGFWQPFVSVGWRFAATATLALGALLTYGASWAKRPQPSMAVTRPNVVRDIFSPEPAGAPARGDAAFMLVSEAGHGNN